MRMSARTRELRRGCVAIVVLWMTLAACESPEATNAADSQTGPAAPPEAMRDRAVVAGGERDDEVAPGYVPVPPRVRPYAFYAADGRWGGVLFDDRIFLDSPTSAGWYVRPVETREFPPGGTRHVATGLVVTIEEGNCSDAALQDRFPDGVVVEWDSGTHRACGGERGQTGDLARTSWRVTRLDGEQAPTGSSPTATLLFGADGRLGGTLQCNDGGIRARWADGAFAVESPEIESTAMECSDAPNAGFAMSFWAAMGEATHYVLADDTLTVFFADGRSAELSRLL